ncbi:MAG: metal-dependent hydrolase [Spongiibacteraceae bacterium]
MKPRYPKFDFSTFKVHWAKNPEFAQRYNALSTVPAHIEPFLVKVMIQARKLLAPDNKQLLSDIDVFIKQENQHCQQHIAFNKILHEHGYVGLKAIEVKYKADYDDYLVNKSLKFNLAYSEGFEAMGSAGAENLFVDLKHLWDDADSVAVELWKWHLAEEFEHREVCFETYRALYCKGFFNKIINGYFYRVYGYIAALIHIGKHTKKCIDYLISVDRETMTPEQLEQSYQREKALKKVLGKAYRMKTLRVFSPFYNPGKKPIPPGLEQYLTRIPDVRS